MVRWWVRGESTHASWKGEQSSTFLQPIDDDDDDDNVDDDNDDDDDDDNDDDDDDDNVDDDNDDDDNDDDDDDDKGWWLRESTHASWKGEQSPPSTLLQTINTVDSTVIMVMRRM